MDLKEMHKEDNIDGIITRRAVPDDIDALVHISRICFPDQLIWCHKRQAIKTWKRFIQSEFQEVWVCQFNNEIVALIRLAKDKNKCEKEIQELKPNLFLTIFYLIAHPGILYEKIFRKINNIYSTNIIYDNEANKLAKNSIWCHSSAVLPKIRNRGIGSKMMSICEKRGFESGYDSIRFLIRTNNKGSIRLHERLGFKRVAKVKGGLYMYIKMLSAS